MTKRAGMRTVGRKLACDFLNLPPHVQVRIATRLHLNKQKHEGLADTEKVVKWFEHALRYCILTRLREEVMKERIQLFRIGCQDCDRIKPHESKFYQ